MSYPAAFALDLLLGSVLAGASLGAAAAITRYPLRVRLVLVAACALCAAVIAGKVAIATILGQHSSMFAERRLLVELPIIAVPLVVAAAITARRLSNPDAGATARAQAGWLWAGLTSAGVTADAIVTRRWAVLAAVPVLAGLAALAGLRQSTPVPGRQAWFARPEMAIAIVLALAVGAAAVGGIQSRLPGSYDLGALATMDAGEGRPSSAHHAVTASAQSTQAVSVEELTGPRDRPADVSYTLEATEFDVDGRQALAFNGVVPGPTITAEPGQLIEVVLRNKDVEDGVSVHWHGYDVPNAEDGVAGVTQNTVKPGGSHTYRFLAEQIGTFWYHSHQASSVQVERGLYGALVVAPPPAADAPDDIVVLDHSWRGPQGFLLGDVELDLDSRIERRDVLAGTRVRLRLINSRSNYNRYTVVGTSFRLTAVDGVDLNRPGEVGEQSFRLAAGGRYDLSFTMPDSAVTVTGFGEGYRLVLGGGQAAEPSVSTDWPELELAGYGEPETGREQVLPPVDREFTMDIDRRLGWLDGRPGFLWTVNGESYPKMPMFMVSEGDLVRVTIVNRTLADHPIHLHGHHMAVREKNSVPITGSPWSSDTLNVAPGEQYVVTFRADNPGIWMDHCHNLDHAAQGFVMHVGYEGVRTPYRIGKDSGNTPE